jgi:murein DD-endopeptidase MepM/ murein hydrolase activator NlpD
MKTTYTGSRIRFLVTVLFLVCALSLGTEMTRATPADAIPGSVPVNWQPLVLGAEALQTMCGTAQLVETTLPWQPDLHRAVSTALCNRPANILPGDYRHLIMTSLDLYNNEQWGVATVIMRPANMPATYDSLLLFPGAMIVANKSGGAWTVSFEGTSTFERMVQQSPLTIFNQNARALLLNKSIAAPEGLPPSLNLKWPLKPDQPWAFTQSQHNWNGRPNSNGSAIDIGAGRIGKASDREVRAAAAGTIYRICEGSRQKDILIAHSSQYATGYLHLDPQSSANLGATIAQGRPLGVIIYSGTDKCGESRGPHLHFYIARGSNQYPPAELPPFTGTTLSGWVLQSNGCFTKPGETNICVSTNALISSDNTDDIRLMGFDQTVSDQIGVAGERNYHYFNGTAGQVVTIEMKRTSGTLDPYVILYKPNGGYLYYNDDANGSNDSRLVQRLPDNGRYQIVAKSWESSNSPATRTGGYTIKVMNTSGNNDIDDGAPIANGQTRTAYINPATDDDYFYFSGVQGRIISIRMEKQGGSLNSYLELYDPNGSFVASDDDGGGWTSRNAWLVSVLPRTGWYRIKARSYNRASSGAYTISARMIDGVNYALNKPARASSVESSSYAPFRAVDGQLNTRWASRSSDPQWIQIDLGQTRNFDTVKLVWETAYAKRYRIEVSTGGSSWTTVHSQQNGRGSTEIAKFGMTSARYVRMYGVQRGTWWGYSLYEFGVYNSTLTTAPIVPPGDPDQPTDAVAQTAPLPLPEEEFGKEVIALFLGEGADSHEIEVLPGVDSDPPEALPTGNEGVPSASIDSILPGYPGGGVIAYPNQTIQFEGSAEDNDAEGSPGIIEYEWSSDRDGVLSNQATFTRLAATLSYGIHVITFRARDNEGNWSDVDQMTIEIIPYNFYLPAVIR